MIRDINSMQPMTSERLNRFTRKRVLLGTIAATALLSSEFAAADEIFFPQQTSRASLYIVQQGDGNRVGDELVTFEQSVHADQTHASISQIGHDNSVIGRQSGRQAAIIEQGDTDDIAIGNRIYVSQTGAVAADATANTLEIEMAGRNNGAQAIDPEITPSVTPYAWLLDNGGGSAVQHGDGNQMELDIEGDNNTFAAYQGTDKTSVEPMGVYSRNNMMEAELEGDNNTLVAFQGLDNNLMTIELEGDGNTITAGQFGISNELELVTLGDNNLITIDQGFGLAQTGSDYNLVNANVSGWNNRIAVTQQGSFNSAYLTQVGSNNSIVVRQSSLGL